MYERNNKLILINEYIKYKLTCVVADVGKTRIWVADTSCGVDNAHLTDAWLNLSSGVNWSGIRRSAESGSSETRHADRMHGTSWGYSRLHWPHISFRFLEAFSNDLRLSNQLQPKAKYTEGSNNIFLFIIRSHKRTLLLQLMKVNFCHSSQCVSIKNFNSQDLLP